MEHFSVLWRCYVTADMQEKSPFVSKAEKLKAEYNKKMDAYNNKTAGGPTASGDSDKSKSEVNDEDEEGDE